jgi:hypothetical protein
MHSVVPSIVAGEEISSFVRHTNEVVSATGTLRHTKLMPRRNKTTGRWETSICRSSGISENEFWSICRKFYDPFSDRPAIGRGISKAQTIYNEGLGIDPNGIPYPQHADIVGWHDDPSQPDDETKNYRMEQAKRIAPQFVYRTRPEGT